ncbi:hypothetical protein HMPREF3091_01935 [Hafnia sp. HMSC23F03]|nr:hypothetical protein HMPREF3091_01935 [Hafnia sp. HMSC23F03]
MHILTACVQQVRKADGEAFVCWLLALESDNQVHINILHNLPAINRSQLLRSMAETVAWIPKFQARFLVQQKMSLTVCQVKSSRY